MINTKNIILEKIIESKSKGAFEKKNIYCLMQKHKIDTNYIKQEFPNIEINMAIYYNKTIIKKALIESKKFIENNKNIKTPIHKKIQNVIWESIPLLEKNRNVSLSSFNILTKKENILKTINLAFYFADKIWVNINDKTPVTNYNYFTKRIILSYVLFCTFKKWVNDKSKKLIETKNHLYCSIKDVLKIQRVKNFNFIKNQLKEYEEYLKNKNLIMKKEPLKSQNTF